MFSLLLKDLISDFYSSNLWLVPVCIPNHGGITCMVIYSPSPVWHQSSKLEISCYKQDFDLILKSCMSLNLIKIRSKLLHCVDITLRVISDWPFNEPVESQLPKFGPVAYDRKCKMTFDVMYVTCKHSETLAPFSLGLGWGSGGNLL